MQTLCGGAVFPGASTGGVGAADGEQQGEATQAEGVEGDAVSKPKRWSKARAYGSRKGCWGRSAKRWMRLFRGPRAEEWEADLELVHEQILARRNGVPFSDEEIFGAKG